MVRLEGLGVQHAVEHSVGAGLVRGAGDAEHAGPRGGVHRTLPGEAAGSVGEGGVGPHAHAVDMRTRTVHGVGNGGGQHRRRASEVVALDEVEDVAGVDATGGGEAHGVRVDEALVRIVSRRGRGERSHERVELHVVAARGGEVQLHRQHAVRLHLLRGTNEAVVLVLRVAAGRGSGRTHQTVRHVVAVHLHTVHVRNDAVAVIHRHLVRSHVGETSERLAEVLRAGNGRGGAQRHRGPAAIREVQRVPVGIDTARGHVHLPLRALRHGVVQRKSEILLHTLRHVILEHDVTVQTRNAHPGAACPGIATGLVRVLQQERVLVVGGSSKTVLIRALLIVSERSARLQNRGTVHDSIGFFRGKVHALLRDRHVDFSVAARECANGSRNYALELGRSTYIIKQITMRCSFSFRFVIY